MMIQNGEKNLKDDWININIFKTYFFCRYSKKQIQINTSSIKQYNHDTKRVKILGNNLHQQYCSKPILLAHFPPRIYFLRFSHKTYEEDILLGPFL